MDKLEFYKSFYDRENQRRETLNDSLNVPIGIISALIVALIFLLSDFFYQKMIIVQWIFLFCALMTIISLTASIYYLIKSYNNFFKGYNYWEIALLSEIENYHLKLIKHHKKKAKADSKFEKYIINEFIKYSDNNAEINDKRSFNLFKSKQFIITSLIALALTFIPYSVCSYNNEIMSTKIIKKDYNTNCLKESEIDTILDIK